MDRAYDSAIINRDTYMTITKRIHTLKQLMDTKEKRENFVLQDSERKKGYLDAMAQDLCKTVLYATVEEEESDVKNDLSKSTFIIPFKKDFPERLVNLTCLLNFIGKYFNTKIMVFEQGEKCSYGEIEMKYKTNIEYYFLKSAQPFSRTSVSNYLIERATTNIIIINDTDCFTYPQAYKMTQDRILNEGFKLLHPFGTPPGSHEITEKSEFMENYDINRLKITSRPNIAGVGGILFIDRELYGILGNENVGFISYSPEDIERVKRIQKLGFKCSESYNEKIAGPNNRYSNSPLFHLCHPRTEESTILHKYYVSNELLNYCLEMMTCEERIEYLYKYSKYEGTLEEYIEKIHSFL